MSSKDQCDHKNKIEPGGSNSRSTTLSCSVEQELINNVEYHHLNEELSDVTDRMHVIEKDRPG